VQEYFEKPVTPEALVEALDRYCLHDLDLAPADPGTGGDESEAADANPAATVPAPAPAEISAAAAGGCAVDWACASLNTSSCGGGGA
jgi:hypothetical protein